MFRPVLRPSADLSTQEHRQEGNIEFLMGPFLGAFAKLRKVTISFVMFFCLSVRMEQLGFHWTDSHEI